MSKTKDVRAVLLDLIRSINAPLPANCRMLPDGTVVNLTTKERFYQAELNRRYLMSILESIVVPLPADIIESISDSGLVTLKRPLEPGERMPFFPVNSEDEPE